MCPNSRRHANSNRRTLRDAQRRVAEMPERDLSGLEQARMRIVVIGEIVEKLGKIQAGVERRKVAAKGLKTLDEHALGQEVERIARFVQQHDIANAQEVKAGSERRL